MGSRSLVSASFDLDALYVVARTAGSKKRRFNDLALSLSLGDDESKCDQAGIDRASFLYYADKEVENLFFQSSLF